MDLPEPTEPGPGGGRLSDLSEDECWELLRTRPFGRLIWSGVDGLSAIPVNFEVAERRILLRTAAYTAMAREVRDREVAFQVDQVDVDSHSGWSVLVRGVCHEAEPGDGEAPEAWASGTRNLVFAINPREITGRRLG